MEMNAEKKSSVLKEHNKSEEACIFRKLTKPKNIRKRSADDENEAQEALKGKTKASGDDKLYKGMNYYTDHRAGFRREQTVAAEKAGGAHGPLRASAHIKVSTRFDYQP